MYQASTDVHSNSPGSNLFQNWDLGYFLWEDFKNEFVYVIYIERWIRQCPQLRKSKWERERQKEMGRSTTSVTMSESYTYLKNR